MRVVHVVRQFSPSVGGLEDAVLNLAGIQRRVLGLDTRVVTLDRVFRQAGRLPATDEVAGIPVRRLPWRGSTRYPIAPGVLGAIAGADLVHVHAVDFFFDFLALTRPLHGRKLVASTHGGFFHSSFASRAKRIWFGSVTRASCAAYDRIIASSKNDEALFRGLAGTRLRTIELGIDVTKFSDAASPVACRTILSFGRFARHKRIELLFPLLAALRARSPDWRLIVAGTDADATVQELRAAASAAGVEDAVRFVINPSDEDLRVAMHEARYYVSASSHEGFGIAAVEALSAGLVPVLNDIPPFRRLVEQTGVGLVADLSDAGSTAARLEAYDREADHAVSRRAAIASVAQYDWRDIAKRFAVQYAEVLARPDSLLTLAPARS